MAVDTERKRRSVLQIPAFTILPPADSAIDNLDRMVVSYLYGGITPMGPSAETVSTDIVPFVAYIRQVSSLDMSIMRIVKENAYIRRVKSFEVER